MTSPVSQKQEQPVQPSPNDVLLGRASHIYNHPGNIRYRCVISSNHRKYHACKTRLDKMIFIRQITKDILDDGNVKFWKIDKKSGKWKLVDFRTVQDKVSHALRDSKTSMSPCEDVMSAYTMKPKPMIMEPSAFASNRNTAERLALEPRSNVSLQLLEERKRQLLEDRDRIDMVRSALRQRQHNLHLSSMSALGVTPNVPVGGNQSLYSMIRELPRLGVPSTARPNRMGSTDFSFMDKYGLNSFYS